LEVAAALQWCDAFAVSLRVGRNARWFSSIGAGVLLLAVVYAAPPAAASSDVRATFAAPIRGDDGRVNVHATIRRVRALHANAYAFQIKRDTDWQDLRRFARVAQVRELDVWVYLAPPCRPSGGECPDYEPFQDDYVAWAAAIARLSVSYPVVTAWVIDDFATHTEPPRDQTQRYVSFTPSYMSTIREAVRNIQPRLELYPVVYRYLLTSRFVETYARFFDALIMPYQDDPYRNNLLTDTLPQQLEDASELLEPRRRELILMVYAHPLSSRGATPRTRKITVPPDVEYVRRATSVGLRYSRAGVIAGVIQYVLPLIPGRPQVSEVSAHSGGSMAVAAVDGGTATSAGNWAGALTRIVLDSRSSKCRMKIWHRDNRTVDSRVGYQVKQVLVAGDTVWQRDVASDGTAWYTSRRLDLTPYLARGQAQLILRLYEKSGVSNYRVSVRFDDISLTGCHTTGDPGFESSGSAWTYIRRGGPVIDGRQTGPVIAGRHTADPIYSSTVFKAVAELYAS
jgi:hypothetical protein